MAGIIKRHFFDVLASYSHMLPNLPSIDFDIAMQGSIDEKILFVDMSSDLLK